MKLTQLLVFIFIFTNHLCYSQDPNHSGFSYFKTYNSQLISSEITQKNIFSFGTGVSQFTSQLSEPITTVREGQIDRTLPMFRIGLGYHHLFLKNKKMSLYKKSRYEFSGFSLYANAYGNLLQAGTYIQTSNLADSFNLTTERLNAPQLEIRFTYTNPFLSFRGKVFSFYLLHEYGLSIMNGTSNSITKPNERKTGVFVNLVPLSLKFGKRPMFFKSSVNFSLDSHLLQPEKIRGSYGLELQIYFYKTKSKK